MSYELDPNKTLGIAIINDEPEIVSSLKSALNSGFPGACLIHEHEDFWGLYGLHLYQFVFVDVSALSACLTEDIRHTHGRIGMFMSEHPWIRLVITSKLPRSLMGEHLAGIRDAADGREPLFLGSFNSAVVDLIKDNLPDALRLYPVQRKAKP